jgi:uncharacterized membrane protein YhhN
LHPGSMLAAVRSARMEPGHWLVVAALAVAGVDCVAVARGPKALEYVCKPLALILLIVSALALRGGEPIVRWGFTVAALAFSLVGDVLLMLPRDLFLAGLASFMVAHVAYIAAFSTAPVEPGWLAVAALGVALVAAPLTLTMLKSLRAGGRRGMAAPVVAYVVVIGGMVVSALVTPARPGWTAGRSALAIAGALLFMTSDGLIGWTRFVRPLRRAPVTIMVTYHLGQLALVLALVGG